MGAYSYFFLLFVVLCTSEVIDLTDENFRPIVKKAEDQAWLLEFFAPWCGHCKRFAPTYKEASEDPRTKRVRFAAIDVPANKQISDDFDIHSFPTILFYYRDRVYKFKGERSVEGIVNYLQSVLRDPFTYINKKSQVPDCAMYEVKYMVENYDADVEKWYRNAAILYLDKSYIEWYLISKNDASRNSLTRFEKHTPPQTITIENERQIEEFIDSTMKGAVNKINGHSEFRPLARASDYLFMLILPEQKDESEFYQSVHNVATSCKADSQQRSTVDFGIAHFSDLKYLLEDQVGIQEEDAPVFVVYHDYSAAFLVSDSQLSTDQVTSAGNHLVSNLGSSSLEWKYALPFTSRASRYVQMNLENYGIVGQIALALTICCLLFITCYCLDSCIFPDDEEWEKRRKKHLEEKEKKKEVDKENKNE